MFIPDCNLGSFIQKQLPNKEIKLINGGCPVHAAITEDDVVKAKQDHPEALVLVHPECVADVVKHADYAGSTSGIIKAEDPYAMVEEMLYNLRKAWDELNG